MFLISGGGGLLGGVLGTSFVYALGIILEVKTWSRGGTLVGLEVGEKDVALMGHIQWKLDEDELVT